LLRWWLNHHQPPTLFRWKESKSKQQCKNQEQKRTRKRKENNDPTLERHCKSYTPKFLFLVPEKVLNAEWKWNESWKLSFSPHIYRQQYQQLPSHGKGRDVSILNVGSIQRSWSKGIQRFRSDPWEKRNDVLI
jgi:hypothetical protein